jgi:hypothetical protein
MKLRDLINEETTSSSIDSGIESPIASGKENMDRPTLASILSIYPKKKSRYGSNQKTIAKLFVKRKKSLQPADFLRKLI